VRIGVDLGGTKIEAIALADDGTTLTRIPQMKPQF
jgi:predicted NBD/HSP70 family sugar kinase